MGQIILVSGGISSGKSAFAEELTQDICQRKNVSCLYIATSNFYDEEMKEKIRLHKIARMAKNWDTLEAYKNLASIILDDTFEYGVLIVDCISMMVSGLIFEDDIGFEASDRSECRTKEYRVTEEVKNLIYAVRKKDIDMVVVTNEIGLGGINQNRLTRFYTELVGRVNQSIARESDQVYMVVSSIGVRIK